MGGWFTILKAIAPTGRLSQTTGHGDQPRNWDFSCIPSIWNIREAGSKTAVQKVKANLKMGPGPRYVFIMKPTSSLKGSQPSLKGQRCQDSGSPYVQSVGICHVCIDLALFKNEMKGEGNTQNQGKEVPFQKLKGRAHLRK